MNEAEKTFLAEVDRSARMLLLNNSPELPEEPEVRKQYSLAFDGHLIFDPSGAKLDKGAEIDRLVNAYLKDNAVTKRLGFAYADEDTLPWLAESKDELDWFYWRRYQNYLINKKHWSWAAARSIEKDTFAILDLMANPKSPSSFERRGLVVASVQSGKTANYTGLICRAADAGYKIIIVMAGVHNILRSQTQGRLEEGFVGVTKDGSSNNLKYVGVGEIDNTRQPRVCTSRETDFNAAQANSMWGLKADDNEPYLFVIKKNSNSLKRICNWLRDHANPNDPLLLIDDEADNASINGKYKHEKRDDEPSRINGQIRTLLGIFNRRCYVGYTATPFANILIDPETDSDDYGTDLFPKSFVYTLEESTDYFGASKVFGDIDEPSPKHLRLIDDIDDVLPPKHKSNFMPTVLPESLREAIRTYVLATAIRALRGDADKHSTMMVNASPYKCPQNTVAALVSFYLQQLNDATKAYGALDTTDAIAASDDIALLKATYDSEYRHTAGIEWETVQRNLYRSTKDMRVVSINESSNDVINYDMQTEHVIAVGGYRLSRGLTLEGLVVSYYSRNAKAYDALMQMARWFGYRPGYEDLCRVWMSDQAAEWYKFVADATDDLFDELRDMRQVGSTPRDYGLRIRQSPDSLMVTARNKFGAGKLVRDSKNLSGKSVETTAFMRNEDIQASNQKAAEKLLSALSPYTKADGQQGPFFSGVPYSLVEDFLRAYSNDDTNSIRSSTGPILEYIDDRVQGGELLEWDVLVAHGSKHTSDELVTLPTIGTIYRERRSPGDATTLESVKVGSREKLAGKGVDKAGLTEEEIESAIGSYLSDHPGKRGSDCPDRYFRKLRTNALLVIHPVCMQLDQKNSSKLQSLPEGWPDAAHKENAMGWTVSFPYTTGNVKLVNYVFNAVALSKNRAGFEEDSDDDFEEE